MTDRKPEEKTEEQLIAEYPDEDLLDGIKKLGKELAKRRRPAIEAQRNKPHSRCQRCGRTFTRAEHEQFKYCPECGSQWTELIKNE